MPLFWLETAGWWVSLLGVEGERGSEGIRGAGTEMFEESHRKEVRACRMRPCLRRSGGGGVVRRKSQCCYSPYVWWDVLIVNIPDLAYILQNQYLLLLMII